MLDYRPIRTLSAVFLILLLPAAAFADTVQGRIAKTTASAVDLTVYDNQGRPYPNTLHLKVDSRTRLNGVPSVVSFRRQDPVSASVKQETGGTWRADSISLLQNAGTTPGPAQPSPSLMDALRSPAGQNVIKRGLTGAVVGGVASGASGGKAGKGALIGAGAGIVGGWLSDILSGPSQPQANSSASVTTQDNSRN